MTTGPLVTLPDTPATQERRLCFIQQLLMQMDQTDTVHALLKLSLVEMTGIEQIITIVLNMLKEKYTAQCQRLP